MSRLDSERRGPLCRIAFVALLIGVVCLLFLAVDVRHRIDGYRVVRHGARGEVAVTHCDRTWRGTSCSGDFISTDGRIRRPGVRVNGAHRPGALLPGAVSGRDAHEAWTVRGSPWLGVSRIQLASAGTVIAVVVLGWLLIRGRLYRSYRDPARSRRERRELDRYRRLYAENPRRKNR